MIITRSKSGKNKFLSGLTGILSGYRDASEKKRIRTQEEEDRKEAQEDRKLRRQRENEEYSYLQQERTNKSNDRATGQVRETRKNELLGKEAELLRLLDETRYDQGLFDEARGQLRDVYAELDPLDDRNLLANFSDTVLSAGERSNKEADAEKKKLDFNAKGLRQEGDEKIRVERATAPFKNLGGGAAGGGLDSKEQKRLEEMYHAATRNEAALEDQRDKRVTDIQSAKPPAAAMRDKKALETWNAKQAAAATTISEAYKKRIDDARKLREDAWSRLYPGTKMPDAGMGGAGGERYNPGEFGISDPNYGAPAPTAAAPAPAKKEKKKKRKSIFAGESARSLGSAVADAADFGLPEAFDKIWGE